MNNSFVFYTPEGICVYERQGMHLLNIAGLRLYKPRASEEVRFRMLLERELRRFTKPGTYIGEEAQSIIQRLYEVAADELGRLLPMLAGREFFEFLVFMHTQWGCLMNMAQQGKLNEEEAEIYWKVCPSSRRTLRYLLEKSIQLAPFEQNITAKKTLPSLLDTVYIATRNLIDLSDISDQLHYFYSKGEVELIIFPPHQSYYFELHYQPDIQDRLMHFQRMKIEHYTVKGEEFEDTKFTGELLREQLNIPFQQEIGITFEQGISLCYQLKQFCRAPENSFDVFFILEDTVHQAIARNCSLPEEAVRRFIAGLTLTKESIDEENRAQFDTKRHFQPSLRPFARLPHPLGPHLDWDTLTLEATIPELIGHMTFQKIPQEWRFPAIKNAISKISQILSRRFTRQVSKTFENHGWRNDCEVEYLTDKNGRRHRITPGEIDILALSADAGTILQVECKRVCQSEDTRTSRDDLSDFYGDGEFFKKAKDKHTWLMQNQSILAEHMERKTGLSVSTPIKVCPLFLTLYPSFAAVRAIEIPVVSAKVFFKRLKEGRTYWPDFI